MNNNADSGLLRSMPVSQASGRLSRDDGKMARNAARTANRWFYRIRRTNGRWSKTHNER